MTNPWPSTPLSVISFFIFFVSCCRAEVNAPYDKRNTGYAIAGSILGATLLVAIAIGRFGKLYVNPRATLVLQIATVLLLWAMVAVVVVYANKDYDGNEGSDDLAFGEATAFVLALTLIPTTKHVGLGVLVGSSYERMLFLHPVLGFTVLVTMTLHMGGMFSTRDDLLSDGMGITGFLSWLSLLCVVLPAMFLRRRSYTLFRVTHCMFVLVLVFGVIHYSNLILMLIPALVLWAVDLALRLRSAMSAKAQVVGLLYHKDADLVTLRLSVNWAAAPMPGSYVFLLVPSLSKISHPFSVALAEEVDAADATRRIVTCYIKSNGGATFTAALAECAVAGVVPAISLLGPHGNLQVPITDCRHVVLVGGGIGVTPMIAILEYIATNIAALPKLEAVTLVWVARGGALFDALRGTVDALAAVCAAKVPVNICCYDSSASTHNPSGIQMAAMTEPERVAGDSRAEAGRPDFEKVFGAIQSEHVGCYICGPAALMDDASKEASRRSFSVHTETFEL
jgi:predicted ferric reductase